MAKSIKVWDGNSWQDVAVAIPNVENLTTQAYVANALIPYITESEVANTLTSYATQVYVANAVSSATVNLSTAAGSGIDWNSNTSQYDIANTIATKVYVDILQYGSAISGTSYTLGTSDLGNLIETTSSSAITVTIPSDPTDSTFPIGSSVEFRQMGTGRITFSPTSPATMVSTDSYTKTRTQYSSVVLEKRANNAWILAGDIDA